MPIRRMGWKLVWHQRSKTSAAAVHRLAVLLVGSGSVVDRVIVSTDDADIANVAKEFGAEVPFLRERFADAEAPVSLATADTVEWLWRHDIRMDAVVQLFAVAPLRK